MLTFAKVTIPPVPKKLLSKVGMDPEPDPDALSLNLGDLLAYKRRGARSPLEEVGQRALRFKQAVANQLLYNREESAKALDSGSSSFR